MLELLPGGVTAAVVGVLAGLITGSKFVQEGQRGVRVRFGRARREPDKTVSRLRRMGRAYRRDDSRQVRVVRPGFVFIWPLAESLYRTHVRQRTLNLRAQEMILKDQTVFIVNGILRCHVGDRPQDVENALFATIHLETTAIEYVSTRLRDVVQTLTHEELSDSERVSALVELAIVEKLEEWGLVVDSFSLSECYPSLATAEALIQEKSAVYRADALIKAAARLGVPLKSLSTTVAAALIGTPVATSLGNTTYSTVQDTPGDSPVSPDAGR